MLNGVSSFAVGLVEEGRFVPVLASWSGWMGLETVLRKGEWPEPASRADIPALRPAAGLWERDCLEPAPTAGSCRRAG